MQKTLSQGMHRCTVKPLLVGISQWKKIAGDMVFVWFCWCVFSSHESLMQRGVELFLKWEIMQGVAMILQNRYQRQRLYTRIALGKAGASNVVRNVGNRNGFTVKKPVQQVNVGPKPKANTLDSLFANMKEERMRVISRQNNNNNGTRRDRQGQPWASGRRQGY